MTLKLLSQLSSHNMLTEAFRHCSCCAASSSYTRTNVATTTVRSSLQVQDKEPKQVISRSRLIYRPPRYVFSGRPSGSEYHNKAYLQIQENTNNERKRNGHRNNDSNHDSTSSTNNNSNNSNSNSDSNTMKIVTVVVRARLMLPMKRRIMTITGNIVCSY